MTMLTFIMMALSIVMALIMVPRIYGCWLQFKEYLEGGEMDRLIGLQALHNEWVIRHLCMALLALGLVTAMKYLPELAAYSETAAATAVYCVISFTFAFVESLMAQKISGYTATILQPVKEPKKEQRY